MDEPCTRRRRRIRVLVAGAEVAVVHGNGGVLSQLFHRNFPDYSAGFSVNIPFRNRAAQADYVTDQLQLRQSELQLQRVLNQVRVDVKTALIGIQQENAVFGHDANHHDESHERRQIERHPR